MNATKTNELPWEHQCLDEVESWICAGERAAAYGAILRLLTYAAEHTLHLSERAEATWLTLVTLDVLDEMGLEGGWATGARR